MASLLNVSQRLQEGIEKLGKTSDIMTQHSWLLCQIFIILLSKLDLAAVEDILEAPL